MAEQIIIANCETGETEVREMTPEEDAAHLQAQAASQAAEAAAVAAQEQRQRDLEAIAARGAEDPTFAALARVLGLR